MLNKKQIELHAKGLCVYCGRRKARLKKDGTYALRCDKCNERSRRYSAKYYAKMNSNVKRRRGGKHVYPGTEEVRCPECGIFIRRDFYYCPWCGTEVGDDS